MPRLKTNNDDPLVSVEILVPRSRLNRFDKLHQDPIRAKLAYGARTRVVNELIENYIAEQEQLLGIG